MKKLFHHAKNQQLSDQAKRYRELIRREAIIGGQIFGPLQPGTRREFFCLDRHTWIWHEEWDDATTGQRRHVTTRYDVRPNGILKTQDGQPAKYLGRDEALNFYQAVKLYGQKVTTEIYHTTSA